MISLSITNRRRASYPWTASSQHLLILGKYRVLVILVIWTLHRHGHESLEGLLLSLVSLMHMLNNFSSQPKKVRWMIFL